jgi:hypothetical protein
MAAGTPEKVVLLYTASVTMSGTMVTRTVEVPLELAHGEVLRITGIRSFFRLAAALDLQQYYGVSWCQVVIGSPSTTRLSPFKKQLICEPLFGNYDASASAQFYNYRSYGYYPEVNMHPEGFVARKVGLSIVSNGQANTSTIQFGVELSLTRWKPSAKDYMRYLAQSA